MTPDTITYANENIAILLNIINICLDKTPITIKFAIDNDNGDGSNWKEDCKINLEKIKSII